MRKTLIVALLGLSLVACKKKEEAAKTDTGSAAAAAMTAAGSAAEAAGSAAAAAGSAAEAAGSAAAAAGSAADTAAAAAAAPGEKPASVTPEMITLADQTVEAINKLGASIEAAGADCKKAVESVKTVAKDVAPLMAKSKEMDAKLKNDKAANDWFEKAYGPKLLGATTKIMGSPCTKDADFQKAMAELSM